MDNQNSLRKYLSPLGIWALSFGCSVGWGSFVMPGTTFLPIAGPVGTAIGMAVGAVIMLIIGRNYYYLMKRYPDAGGAYSYAKHILGFDHGFLCGWFLILAYIVIVWANLTALALIGRNLLGTTFQFGFHYQLAGYDIYFGEILASLGVLAACGFFCIVRKRVAVGVQILMALILIGGILICFSVAVAKNGGASITQPAFSELSSDGKLMQIFSIVALTPWAYVGFESVSNSTEEFNLKKPNQAFTIIIVAVLTAGLAYTLLSWLAVTALPEGFSDWTAYISSLGELEGSASMPTLYAVEKAMGSTGVYLLGFTILGGIITGVIGNTIAASRVLYAIAKDDILPKWFARTNRDDNPVNATLFILLASSVIPFFGRTAISWIVDVTTVGGTIIYAYTSAAALREALREKNKKMIFSGAAGLVLSFLFALYFLIPNLASVSTLATESYLILTVWSILGLVFFRNVFGKDTQNRFGKSIIVWFVLLFLIMFTSIVWMQQENNRAIDATSERINATYAEHVREYHSDIARQEEQRVENTVTAEMEVLNNALIRNNVIRILMIVFAVVILFMVYSLMAKRQREFERVQDMAYKDAMTGIGNNRAFQKMELTINREITEGFISAFAVAVCDLNGLKAVNDTLGHAKGDEFICQGCSIICDVFAHSPVFRTGGDEFVVVLRGRDYENRNILMEAIQQNNRYNEKNGGAVIAVGMSDFIPGEDTTVDMVFARADSAMYQNKKELKTD